MKPSSAVVIQDEVIRGLIHMPSKASVHQTLARTGVDEIWNEFDDPSEEDQELSVKDVPGGTMTFVFERVSKTGL
jgi:hypothetical protein